MKQFRRWCLVVLVAFAILAPVTFSLLHINNVSADTELGTEDLNTIKQNALYKVIYSNLAKCYGSMQGTITESAQNTWASFDSSTYFTDDALADSYLQFPYGVGNQNQSSCPDMITGWNTNWFINLFTGTGSYDGILSLNADAEVPNSDWYDSSTAKMGNFLKDIGYEETTQDDGDLSDRSCFHLRFKLNQSTYDNWWLLEPSSGEYFETVDYCVKLNGDNTLQQYNDSIIALKGNNDYFSSDYDNGHLTDDSNIAFIFFKRTDNALTPQFRHVDDANVDFSNENYLQANVDYVALRYNAYVPGFGADDLQANTLLVQSVTSKTTAEDYSLCSALGYVHCGWYDGGIFSPTIYIGSLMDFGGSITYSQFKSRMVTLVDTMKDDEGYDLFGSVSAVDYNPVDRSYKKGSSNAKFIRYFLGDTSNYNSGTFTDAEKYMLYYTYLKNNYNVATSDTAVGENSVQVSWLNEEDGTFSRAYIYDPDENLSTTQLVLSSDGKWDGTSRANWHEIAEMLAAIDVETAFSDAELTDSVLDPDLAPEDTSGETEDVTANCFNAASSLGWIMCPVIQGIGDVLTGIYDNVIASQFLEVDASLLGSGTGSIYAGWSIFRNIANIIFVILFIIILLSQVTGIGISNYGIKKTLPRLIAVAVLVNISFVICQLAVDLSNILGYGLESMLVNLADQTRVYTVGSFAGDLITGLFSTALTAGATVGVVAIAAVSWEYWLFPLILFLLGCLISILFFAIILGVRSAGILILITVAPIAIVCYALPNTKKIFDRWLKILSALLMVFPICGLLMGGGIYASSLLLSVSASSDGNVGFFFQLVAILLQVVPFFFIPGLVRSSMTAMGALGMKIASLGSRASKGATGAIRRTEGYQDKQKSLAMRNMGRTIRRIDSGKDMRNRIAKGLNRVGMTKAGAKMQDSAQLRHTRTVNRFNKQLSDMADVYKSEYDYNGQADDMEAMKLEHQQALAAVMADSNDTRAKAKLMATHKILGETDAGRSAMEENMFAAMSTIKAPGHRLTQNEEAGMRFAASSLHGSHGGVIKASNRGFESFLADAAQGTSRVKGDFGSATMHTGPNNREVSTISSTYYDKDKISSYDASSIAKADEGALDRIQYSIEQERLSGDEKGALDRITRDALTNSNIHVQDKIRNKLNQIRTAAGLEAITESVSSTDSGSLNPRTQTTGDVLRTGNDSPASRSPQPPIPDGASVTDSGLVIARGDMSGEQIRDFARQMDDYNRRQGNNGQNNSLNGQNNRNR